ncbi:MAG: hypothetical protein RIR62_2877 [Pseudomonadota bacterium]|jgi:hypothetical protein
MGTGGRASPQALERALAALLGRAPLSARSRKVFADHQSDNRFLWSFPRDWLPAPDDPAPLAALLSADLPDEIRRRWSDAPMIHVGFDGAARAGGADIRKLYLELPVTGDSSLAYLAVKCGARGDLHRYDALSDPAALLRDLALPAPFSAAAGALARASGDCLRVAEDGTGRLSIDIGLADLDPDAGLSAMLATLVAAVNPAALPPACWPSHVALGRDRGGEVFVTLYGWPSEDCP